MLGLSNQDKSHTFWLQLEVGAEHLAVGCWRLQLRGCIFLTGSAATLNTGSCCQLNTASTLLMLRLDSDTCKKLCP